MVSFLALFLHSVNDNFPCLLSFRCSWKRVECFTHYISINDLFFDSCLYNACDDWLNSPKCLTGRSECQMRKQGIIIFKRKITRSAVNMYISVWINSIQMLDVTVTKSRYQARMHCMDYHFVDLMKHVCGDILGTW